MRSSNKNSGRAVAAAMAVALCACSNSNSSTTPPTGGNQITVNPGQSIQTAVDSAKPGDTIVVKAGTYHESGRPCAFNKSQSCAVVVTMDDIALQADTSGGPVVLDNPSGLAIGIGVGKSPFCGSASKYYVKKVRVTGFTVKDFKNSGIEFNCVYDWELGFNKTPNNVLYGLYPVWAKEGLVHDNVASGATDTGIYVGISDRVRVYHNTAFNNVTGFEFENTTNSELDRNTTLNNTAGILEFIIPGDPREVSSNNIISNNDVHDNNAPNKCSIPTDPVCLVPPGTGLGVIGGNGDVTIHNTVKNNKTYGIAVADVCTGFALSAKQCKALPFNPLPLNIRTLSNTSLNNGVDLLWTGNGTGNCWNNNTAKTMTPTSLPKC